MRLPWRTPSAGTRGARFWVWFVEHEPELFVATGPGPAFNSLAKALSRVHRGLVFEIGPVTGAAGDTGDVGAARVARRELIISADGILESFPAVTELVCAAPELERWQVVAFRPRRRPATLQLGEVRLEPKDVRARCTTDGRRVGLTLLVRGYRETPAAEFEQAAFLMIDGAIGEYDVETKVGYVEVHPATADEPDSISLDELGDTVDRLYGT